MATKATLKSNSALTMKEADAALLKSAQEHAEAGRKVKAAQAQFLLDLTSYTHRGAFMSLGDEKAVADHALKIWIDGSGPLSAETRKTLHSQYLAAVKLGTSERAAVGIANMEAVKQVWEANAPKATDAKDTRSRLFPTLLKVARATRDGDIKGEISASKAKALAVPPKAAPLSPEKQAEELTRRVKSLQDDLKEALEKAGLSTKAVKDAMADLTAAITKAGPAKVVKLATKDGKKVA